MTTAQLLQQPNCYNDLLYDELVRYDGLPHGCWLRDKALSPESWEFKTWGIRIMVERQAVPAKIRPR